MNAEEAKERWWNELYAWAKSVHTPESPITPEEFMDEMEATMEKSVASLSAKREGSRAEG